MLSSGADGFADGDNEGVTRLVGERLGKRVDGENVSPGLVGNFVGENEGMVGLVVGTLVGGEVGAFVVGALEGNVASRLPGFVKPVFLNTLLLLLPVQTQFVSPSSSPLLLPSPSLSFLHKATVHLNP